MKVNFKSIRLLVAILILPGFFTNEKAYADDYKEYAKQLRQEIWGWDRPEFKNYDVPDTYKNESAVVLAIHEEIIATGKSKVRFDPNLLLALNKELNYTQIYRKLIFLNDKPALEKNSEISFVEQERSYGYRVNTKNKYVIGVRIIKPDGSVREVDMDEAVSITEGKKDKESHKKLAISDLQIGDILDYFFYEEGRVDYQNIPPRDFYLASKYPILSYNIHCEIDKKLTTEYRSVNGAPDFQVTTNDNGDVIMDLKASNLMKVEADRWLSPLRQLPTARLAIYFNSNKNIFKPGSHRDRGVHKDVPAETILHDIMGHYAGNGFYSYAYSETKKKAKKYFKNNPEMDNKAKADYLNLYLRDYVAKLDYVRSGLYLETLRLLFKSFKIEHKVGFVTNRFDARYDEVAIPWDFNAVLTANNDTQIYTSPFSRHYIGNTPYNEGETIHTVVVNKLSPKSEEGIKGVYSKAVFPVSSSSDNQTKTQITVDFSANNPLTLIINEKAQLTGHFRNGHYSRLFFSSEWFEEMAHCLGQETYLETLQKKNKQKDIEEFNTRLEKAKRDRENSIKELIKENYDIDPKELIEFSFTKVGVAADDPIMETQTKYLIDGFVKRAGTNYILDAGKLIGKQLALNDKERNREIDSYFPYARTYQYTVNINIPKGYTLEGINNLNKSVDNEYGKFISRASQDGNILTIAVEKVYRANYVPTSGWNELVEMLDGTNDFYAQSVVLKKM